MIKKRYTHLTEELVNQNPNMGEYLAPSLNTRQDMGAEEVPKLGKEAAEAAIKEWGQPKSKITHLIFSTNSSVHMPGADFHLTTLLALRPSVNRSMMYLQVVPTNKNNYNPIDYIFFFPIIIFIQFIA